MHKNMVRTYGVLIILLAVLTVVAFAVPFVKNEVFWVSYFFVLLAIGLQGYAIYTAFSREKSATSKLYGFPVARVGFVYLLVQIIASLIFMALATILPLWIVIVVSILALGAAGVGFITTDAMREEILRQDTVLKKDVSAMRSIQSKTRMLVSQCEDLALNTELRTLSEAVQYSDPVSSERLQEIEYELTQLIDELQKAVVEQEYDAARMLVSKAIDTLAERNRLCKIYK